MVTIMHAMSAHDSFKWMTSPSTNGGNSGKGEVCVSVWPFKGQQSPDLPVLTLSAVCEGGTGKVRKARMEMDTRRHVLEKEGDWAFGSMSN